MPIGDKRLVSKDTSFRVWHNENINGLAKWAFQNLNDGPKSRNRKIVSLGSFPLRLLFPSFFNYEIYRVFLTQY